MWRFLPTLNQGPIAMRPCCPPAPFDFPPLLFAALIAFTSLTAMSATATAATTEPTAHELHTAECVAVLEVHSDAVALKIKAGRDDLRPALLEELDAGAAFIGEAYLQGERDEARSKALLQSALEAQQALSEPDLAARQAACLQEGLKLFAGGNFLERAVVSRVAEKRMKKLLGG